MKHTGRIPVFSSIKGMNLKKLKEDVLALLRKSRQEVKTGTSVIKNKYSSVVNIFNQLFKAYGPQGWWPLTGCKGSNPTKTGALKGYHPGDFTYPHNPDQEFEIAVGAILTQNTSWSQAEKAVISLKKSGLLFPSKILKADLLVLGEKVKSAGYFNQKSKKLKYLSDFWISLKGAPPSRDSLLALWGIGPETADSILLYAFRVPVFVVDAYTRRIFSRLGIFSAGSDYEELRALFENELSPEYSLFQEYHALIVEHAKRFCRTKPLCQDCPLKRECQESG